MLYSTQIEIMGKEYPVKIGVKELILIKKAGIDITNEYELKDVENIIKIFHISTKTKITLDEMIDLIDSDPKLILDDIGEVIRVAIELGVNKGRKNGIEGPNNEAEETKNV